MTVRPVPPPEWAQFLDQFSRDHHGWLAGIIWSHAGDRPSEILDDRPLVCLTATTKDGRTTAVDVILHPREDPRNTIHVASPTAVRVHETAEGAAQHVEIEGDDGESVLVRFRGVATPDVLLDGMAPGELT